MYEKVNITENGLRVLSLFTYGFTKEHYIREVQKILAISPRTAQLILEDLENRGILESKIRGKIKLYALKISYFSKRYLLLAENYKTIAFMEKNLFIKEVLEKISPFIDGVGILFGSYAKGTFSSSSDLDIFVAGEYDREEVRKVSKNLGVEISVQCYPLKTFEKNISRDPKDFLLKEILKNHFIFKEAERFIEMVLKDG